MIEQQPEERLSYEVAVVRGDMQLVPAGAAGHADLGVTSALVARCASWDAKASGAIGCRIAFRIRFDDSETTPKPAPAYGVGVCHPRWGQSAGRYKAWLVPDEEE